MALLNYDIPKELQEKALEIVEIVKKSGKLKKGANEVTKIVERGTAKLVVLAENTNPVEIVAHIPVLCKEKNIPCVAVVTKEDLGASAGLGVSTTAIGIIQEGEAKVLIKDLTEKLSKIAK